MLRPRPPTGSLAGVCWSCRLRILTQQRGIAESAPLARPQRKTPERHHGAPPCRPHLPTRDSASFVAGHAQRGFHHARLWQAPTASAAATTDTLDIGTVPGAAALQDQGGIRQRLQQWQDAQPGPDDQVLSAFENHPAHGDQDVTNDMSRANPFNRFEQSELATDADDENHLNTHLLFLRPGDVVELTVSGREPLLAVFTQQVGVMQQFLTANGRWAHAPLSSVRFIIPACVDLALLRPIMPYLPTKLDALENKADIHVPTQHSAKTLAILQELARTSEAIYRENAGVLDAAYTTLADQTKTRMMTLNQIAKTLLGRRDPGWVPKPAALLAVRKALLHNEYQFRSDRRSQRLTNVFAIRPKADVDLVSHVHEWLRQYLELKARALSGPMEEGVPRGKGATYVANFIEKARRLIAISRKDRDALLGGVSPSRQRFPVTDGSSALRTEWGESFTHQDRQIISFMEAWVLTRQFVNMPGLHSGCASILQETGCYNVPAAHGDGETHRQNKQTGFLFLQEIGVITPYENRIIYDESLMLPTIRLSRNLELLNTKAELTRRNPDFRDSMADLRRDWGDMTVYCIDGEDAVEIDDGISIERVQGSLSEFWVHVHVANPTAFFDKTHVLSGLAAHMTESVYLPERHFSMLPSWASQNFFSLDENRAVLTFSTKLDLDGNILDRNIQSGIVRKIVAMTPEDVAVALGNDAQIDRIKLTVGGEVPRRPKSKRVRPHLAPQNTEDLKDIYRIALTLWDKRKRAGGVRIGTRPADVTVFERMGQPGLSWTPPSTDRARFVHGDPIIELKASRVSTSIYPTIDEYNIVEEMMLLACNTAARWCAERHVPVIYRGSVESPYEMPSTKFKEQILDPYVERHGHVPLPMGLQYMRSLGKAITHTSCLPHSIIGVDGYLKVTSPLRRFSDMIAHWQIEAALRQEARSGRKFGLEDLESTSRYLPFSQRQLQDSIVTLSPRERNIAGVKQSGIKFWTAMATMRAHLYKEAALPYPLNAYVYRGGVGAVVHAILTELSVHVELFRDRDSADVREGDEWEVDIVRIDTFRNIIVCAPIRLINREV